MSDDERSSESGSGAEDNDIETTGLIATRAKRSTAGNLYANLRAALDDEDIRKDLLADDEDDVGDYEASDKDDDDAAMESSSDDDDDTGPPQQGQPEDLQGESELKKAERAEQTKKRKLQGARLKLPAWQKHKKRVKLADDSKTEDGAAAPPKKKKASERTSWLPTDDAAPKRQSARSLAVQNRETTHANLKQSFERSEKQRRVMANAATKERSKASARREMTLEQRLEMCGKIAKQTDKEFGRWEREEQERQKQRDEAAAMKRRRGVEGSAVRHWSGSAVWRGDKLVEGRVEHGSRKMVEEVEEGTGRASGTSGAPAKAPVTITLAPAQPTHPHSLNNPPPWLSGIHDFAAKPTAPTSQQHYAPLQPHPPHGHPPPQTYSTWPPIPPPAPATLLREQAQRSLLILTNFEQFDNPTTANRGRPKTNPNIAAGAMPTELTSVILPNAHPPFTADELRYLLAKHKRASAGTGANLLPSAPEKTRCAVMPSQVAKYRDPGTGCGYSDLQCYKILQRAVKGEFRWSGVLGAWIGQSNRAARGVPEGFLSSAAPTVPHAQAIKAEGG